MQLRIAKLNVRVIIEEIQTIFIIFALRNHQTKIPV